MLGMTKTKEDIMLPRRYSSRRRERGQPMPPPPGKAEPQPIEKQIEKLVHAFDLDGSKALALAATLPEVPSKSQGWFAIMSLTRLCESRFAGISERLDRELAALDLVQNRIPALHIFSLGGPHPAVQDLRRGKSLEKSLHALEEQQPGPILLLPAQLGGIRRGGWMLERAREELGVQGSREFFLGSFEAGCMILTHNRTDFLASEAPMRIACADERFAGFEESIPVYNNILGWVFSHFQPEPPPRYPRRPEPPDTRVCRPMGRLTNWGQYTGFATGFLWP